MNVLLGEDGKLALKRWINAVADSAIKPLIKFARTIARHYDKIVTYFDHPLSSGLAEGINNLIATVKKKAYGYRNMEYFKLIPQMRDNKIKSPNF